MELYLDGFFFHLIHSPPLPILTTLDIMKKIFLFNSFTFFFYENHLLNFDIYIPRVQNSVIEIFKNFETLIKYKIFKIQSEFRFVEYSKLLINLDVSK